MSIGSIRIAFFADSYKEVDGVALTSRKLVEFARERNYPFLCVRAGDSTRVEKTGSFTEVILKRSAAALSLDTQLKYDPLFNRHARRVRKELEEFAPDLIHITGLNDVSIIGSWLANRLQIPMAGSWHTNIHEFAANRLKKTLGFLPAAMSGSIADLAEKWILRGSVFYYRMPKLNLAPNEEITSLLSSGTGRVSRLMGRGVDAEFFNPAKRTVNDSKLRLGFVGRLRSEKNVRLLADVQTAIDKAGLTNYKFLIVGDGSERGWLEKRLKNAEFSGYLSGEALAEAYANMDIFLFPSLTETFGNVVQEANASGVPAIVTDKGGPKFIVQDGETGFISHGTAEFSANVVKLMKAPSRLGLMKQRSREFAESRSWSAVFESVYQAYFEALRIADEQKSAILEKEK
ncbi:MAG: glycosyltransferase [Blastocatellia bacterium]|nr:glycosyltransferase [Blastocatellia bacterium]